MEKILKNVEADIKKFNVALSQKQKEVEQKEKQLKDFQAQSDKLQKRLDKVANEEASLKEKYQQKRQERQDALYDEQDVTSINKELNKIKEALELKTDEVIPVKNRKTDIEAEIKRVESESSELKISIEELKCKKQAYRVCIEYNTAAEALGKALKNYENFLETMPLSLRPLSISGTRKPAHSVFFRLPRNKDGTSYCSMPVINKLPKLYVDGHIAEIYKETSHSNDPSALDCMKYQNCYENWYHLQKGNNGFIFPKD